MQTQSSARSETSTTPRTVPAPRLNKATLDGLATLIGRVRQIIRLEPVVPFSKRSTDEQEELHRAALALAHSQDPVRTHNALELALQTAEGALENAGFVPSKEGRALARQIALTAITTHRLALEGALDQVGGVQ